MVIEVIVAILLARKISEIASEKGRKPHGYVLMTIGLCFLGEFLVGGTAGMLGAANISMLLFYLIALAGFAAGAAVAFSIVNNLEPVE